MSRKRAAEKLLALEARQAKLLQELTQLAASKRHLSLRTALLSSWCEALSYIQLADGMQQPNAMACDADAGRFEQLVAAEAALLQQLTSKEGCWVSLEQLLQPDSNTIAPCTDPMAYLQHLARQKPTKQMRNMDAAGLAAVTQQTTQIVSIKMHQLGAAAACDHPELVEQMGEAWLTYMTSLYVLIMSRKVDVVEAALTTNLETLAHEPAEASAHQAAQAAMVVPLLQLTTQQEEVIAVGTALYHDLLAAIHRERQAINRQMTAVVEAAGPGTQGAESNNGNTTVSMGSSSSMAAAQSHAQNHVQNQVQNRSQGPDLVERGVRLQKQEELADRLNLLLNKEYHLRMAAMGWFVGCLTYPQLSRMAVVSWPYGVRLVFFATEIMQQAACSPT